MWSRSLAWHITLATTSLGLVVPVLKDAGQSETVSRPADDRWCDRRGVRRDHLLSLFFSATKGGTVGNAVAFGTFGVVRIAVALLIGFVALAAKVGLLESKRSRPAQGG
jgi:hypothetical protein